MFSALRQNSPFYILDKSDTPVLKVGKVISVSSIQYKNNFTQTVDVAVKVGNETLNFNDLPASLSIVDFNNTNMIVSESKDAMTTEIENMISSSQNILNTIDYHKSIVDNGDKMLVQLNPHFAKEKEQEEKIKSLEAKVGNIETGISDMKSMMSELLNKK